MAKKTRTAVKGVKKTWFKIVGPKFLNSRVVGEIILADQRQMLGRTFKVNLMSLIGDPRKQSINMELRVTGLMNDNGVTEVIGYEIMPSSIKRMIRRMRTRIDDSLRCVTADNKRLTVKPFLLTRGKAKGSVLSAIKRSLRGALSESIRKMKFDSLVSEIISTQFQRNLKKSLSKLYPIAVCEIRAIKVISPGPAGGQEKPKEQEPAEKAVQKEGQEQPKEQEPAEKQAVKPEAGKEEPRQENPPKQAAPAES